MKRFREKFKNVLIKDPKKILNCILTTFKCYHHKIQSQKNLSNRFREKNQKC